MLLSFPDSLSGLFLALIGSLSFPFSSATNLHFFLGVFLHFITGDDNAQYRRLPPKKQEEFYAQHASAIISCEAAKRYFDSLGLKKLPSIQSLKQEYVALSAENRKLYPDQKKAKAEMMELLTARHNTERILILSEEEKRQKQRQKER